MSASQARLRERINEALRLVETGELDEATRILENVLEDANLTELGTLTAIGLPRRLHSTLLKIAKRRKNDIERVGLQYLLVPPQELLKGLGEAGCGEQQELARLARVPVPVILHQIWIGNLPVPPSTVAWLAHCRAHGIEYRLWREADLEEIGVFDNPCLKSMLDKGDFPGAVDIARYIVLDRFGGIYLDCDWYPAGENPAITALLPMMGLNALAEDIPRQTGFGSLLLANSLIAAPAGHPVFRHILDTLPDVLHRLPEAPAWWTTGPLVFTLVARRGPVNLADHSIVAGSFARKTDHADILHFIETRRSDSPGILISWKSW